MWEHTTAHAGIFKLQMFSGNRSFIAREKLDGGRIWISRSFGCKPQKEFEFKIAVTADFQDTFENDMICYVKNFNLQ